MLEKFFSENKTTEAEMLRQAPVQCNEDCELKFSHTDSLKVRVRDLFWNGFTVDQIPVEIWEERDREKDFSVRFSVPRQFGMVSFDLNRVKPKPYVDVITSRDMYSIEVNLEDHPQLKNIRDFLVYRNKSFIRRSKRRLKKTLVEKNLLVFWGFILILGVLVGLVFLKDLLF